MTGGAPGDELMVLLWTARRTALLRRRAALPVQSLENLAYAHFSMEFAFADQVLAELADASASADRTGEVRLVDLVDEPERTVPKPRGTSRP